MQIHIARTALSSALSVVLLGMVGTSALAQDQAQDQNQKKEQRSVLEYDNVPYDFYAPGRTILLGVRGTF